MDGFRDLARELGGSFAARARGIVSPGLDLFSAQGETFGRVGAEKAGGTRVEAGDLSATLAPSPNGGYAMKVGDVEILNAEPAGSRTALLLTSGGRAYDAGISPLRNDAVARTPDGKEAARVSGGLAGRRYEATFDTEDPAALPIAIFLLWRLTDLRSRAYRT